MMPVLFIVLIPYTGTDKFHLYHLRLQVSQKQVSSLLGFHQTGEHLLQKLALMNLKTTMNLLELREFPN